MITYCNFQPLRDFTPPFFVTAACARGPLGHGKRAPQQKAAEPARAGDAGSISRQPSRAGGACDANISRRAPRAGDAGDASIRGASAVVSEPHSEDDGLDIEPASPLMRSRRVLASESRALPGPTSWEGILDVAPAALRDALAHTRTFGAEGIERPFRAKLAQGLVLTSCFSGTRGFEAAAAQVIDTSNVELGMAGTIKCFSAADDGRQHARH